MGNSSWKHDEIPRFGDPARRWRPKCNSACKNEERLVIFTVEVARRTETSRRPIIQNGKAVVGLRPGYAGARLLTPDCGNTTGGTTFVYDKALYFFRHEVIRSRLWIDAAHLSANMISLSNMASDRWRRRKRSGLAIEPAAYRAAGRLLLIARMTRSEIKSG